MKLGVVGSRTFTDYELMKKTLDKLKISKLVSGGAIGADSLAEKYAKENDTYFVKFLPDYEWYGKHAPLERNKLIAKESEVIYAFWDGKSRGTKHTIDYARKIGRAVEIVKFKEASK